MVNVRFRMSYVYHTSSAAQRRTLTTNSSTHHNANPIHKSNTIARLVVARYWMYGISRER